MSNFDQRLKDALRKNPTLDELERRHKEIQKEFDELTS